MTNYLGDYAFSNQRSTGANWGGYIGSKAGQFLGGAAQRLLMGAVGGLGDYKVRKNIFAGGRLPEIVNNPAGGGIVVRFQEYLTDIVTSATPGAFSIQSLYLNAANSRTFPFLSQLAANFEQYEFEGVIFQFTSRSGDALNSTNTALGSVIMATQYDSYDTAFTNKTEMLNYEFSTSCKPSDNVIHMIECDPRQSTATTLYTLYDDSPPAGADIRLYNLGLFSIASTGFQAASVNIGELHVTYQVRLLKPKLFTSLGSTSGYMQRAGVSNATIGTPYTAANPLGTAAYRAAFPDTLDSIGVTLTSTTITFPISAVTNYYRAELFWTGDTATAIVVPSLAITNGIVTSGSVPTDATSSTQMCQFIGIKCNGGPNAPVLTVGTGGTVPGVTNPAVCQMIIRIMEVSPLYGAV